MLPVVELPHSRMKESIAQHPEEGRLRRRRGRGGQDAARTLKLELKYQGKKSVIEGLRRVSTPGLRRYVGATEIPRVLGGLGVAVVSTSEGVMTGDAGPQEKSRRRIALLRLVRDWNLIYVANWKTTDCHSRQR